MEYETLLYTEAQQHILLTINRISKKNAINMMLLNDLHSAFDRAEAATQGLIILQGTEGFFSTGMDLTEVSGDTIKIWATNYINFLKKLSSSHKLTVAFVNGKAIAGGVGLAAAADLVVATREAFFKLTEVFWGLLPAMVTPYLIRRVGYQTAYNMALTGISVSAIDAQNTHLVDQINDNLETLVQELIAKPHNFSAIKEYFHKLQPISQEVERLAVDTISESFQKPDVQKRIQEYLIKGKLPWI